MDGMNRDGDVFVEEDQAVDREIEQLLDRPDPAFAVWRFGFWGFKP